MYKMARPANGKQQTGSSSQQPATKHMKVCIRTHEVCIIALAAVMGQPSGETKPGRQCDLTAGNLPSATLPAWTPHRRLKVDRIDDWWLGGLAVGCNGGQDASDAMVVCLGCTGG